MNAISEDTLSPEYELALGYTAPADRDALRTFFLLDQRLARIVSATSEPMLGQMRLAWWRDVLGKPNEERPRGDGVLDMIGEHWGGREDALVKLVDGWEVVIVADQMRDGELKTYAAGRAAPIVALFSAGEQAREDRLRDAMSTFAFAEIATGLSNKAERDLAIACGLNGLPGRSALPPKARGVAVLEALSIRALKRGGRPLMEGRRASLVALKAGLIGR